MEIPKIIFTEAPFGNNIRKIELDYEEFIEMINKEKINTFFSSSFTRHGDKFILYIIKEGYCIFGKGDTQILSDYFATKEKGFIEFTDFMEAQKCGVKESHNYYSFKKSDFYKLNKKQYKMFLDAQKKGFENSGRYQTAINEGIPSREEFDKYIKSRIRPYAEYLKAKEGGFETKDLFDKAQSLGIASIKDLREIYIKKYKHFEDKIHEIINDANKAFDSERYGEFIRLEYLAIGKMAELTFMKLKLVFELERDDERKIDIVINQIEAETKKKVVDLDILDNWRNIRNKIAHENWKIDRNKAEQARSFFQPSINKLLEISKRTLAKLE